MKAADHPSARTARSALLLVVEAERALEAERAFEAEA
jgi:hypothetical protein